MIQKTIRDHGGVEYSVVEGAEQGTEYNDRTVYGVDGFNSIAELGANQAPMKVKTDHLTVTAATDLDTMRSNVSTNNGKNTYPAADATKVGHIGVTQAVDLDTIESDTATNKTNADASKVKTDFISVTQAVDLDTMESDTTTNNAKTGVTTEEANTIDSITAGEPTGSDQVLNVVSLTQAEYDAGSPVSTTFYVIV